MTCKAHHAAFAYTLLSLRELLVSAGPLMLPDAGPADHWPTGGSTPTRPNA